MDFITSWWRQRDREPDTTPTPNPTTTSTEMDGASASENARGYRPIRSSETRFVRIHTSNENTDTLELSLHHFAIEDAPPYLALSYVWGSASDSKEVNLNGRTFTVRRNLHDALHHLRDLVPYFKRTIEHQLKQPQLELWLWIDALCIDQENIDEKSEQVPRMSTIFSSAFVVVVWFGTMERLETSVVGFQTLMYILERTVPLEGFFRPTIDFKHDTPIENMQPSDIIPKMVKTYGSLMLNVWFKRVWVIQEYALGRRDPCALVGHALFSFRALHAITPTLLNMANSHDHEVRIKAGSLIRVMTTMNKLDFGSIYMRSWITSAEFQRKHAAEQLLSIIMNLGHKAATVPHDHIYGLLGMVNIGGLPESLKPDYRLPYENVCTGYTKFIIEYTKDLRILMFRAANRLSNQPSWAMDFSCLSPWKRVPETPHEGFFIDDQKLVVEGVQSGTVLSYFVGNQEGPSNYDGYGERMRHFHDTVLDAAAKIRQLSLQQVWQEWFADFLEHHCAQEPSVERYPTAARFLETVLPDGESDIADGVDRKHVLTTFAVFDFMLVSDGSVALCRSRHKEGDVASQEIWKFKGSDQRSIIQRRSDGLAEYLGFLLEASVDIDGEFFSRNELQNIILV